MRIFQRTLSDEEISALANPFWWKFDNFGMDQAGYGYFAELKNGAAYVAHDGGSFGALSLNGSNAFAEVRHDPELDLGTGDFAISTWFYRLPNDQSNLRILSKGAGANGVGGYAIFGSNNSVTVTLGAEGLPRKYVAGNFGGVRQWNHLAVNFQRSGNMSLYINGELKSATPISDWSGLSLSNPLNLEIGRNGGSQSEAWAGRVDDLRIFKRTLSSGEINALCATAPDVAARTAPRIVSAVSRHSHADRIEDLAIYAGDAASNVEPRRTLAGGTHVIVVNCDQYVASGTAAVIAGTATIASTTVRGKALLIDLGGVSDRQKVVLRITGLQSLYGKTMAPVDIPIRFLVGDLNRDGNVTLSADGAMLQDYLQTPSKRSETARVVSDCLADGLVDMADWAALQANIGQSVAP